MSCAPAARAQTAEIVLSDGLIGAGFGAAMGIAHATMTHDHHDGMRQVPVFAAIGAILGMVAGGLEVSGAFASYDADSGRLVWGMPVPCTTWRDGDGRVELGLLNVDF